MVEITVRAADSSLAMEEVQKKLGDDALIISTSKKDGKIEIVATDDEQTLKKKEIEPLLLGEAYKTNTFDEVLQKKLNVSTAGDKNVFDSQSIFKDRLNKIVSDIYDLNVLFDESMSLNTQKISLLSQLQTIGFRRKTLDSLGIKDNAISPEVATKKIAKAFVAGKAGKFETSNLYLIVGDRLVGKSTFAEKFLHLMVNTQSERDFSLVQDSKLRKLDVLLRDLGATLDDEGNSEKALILDLTDENTGSNNYFKKVISNKYNFNVSVIRIMEVGRSYEYLVSSPQYQAVFPEYVAFSKLDICDLSVPEISAMIDMKNQCMFLAGIDDKTEGLYFAKVDQIASFLMNKFKDEHG